MDPPDFQSLRCFLAAAELLNFRAAAKQVALSPAAFSDRIKQLEARLDAALFERSTRHVALTAAGRRLLGQARHAVEAAERCLEVVHEGYTPPFELTLGTRYELGLSWLVPALDDLARARPERTLHLYFGDSPDLLARLERGAVDGVVSSVRLTRAGLDYAQLHTEAYVLCASPASLARHPLEAPIDASAHTLIDAHPDLPLFRYFLDARASDAVWAFARTEHLGTIAAVRHRVLSGGGVAVLPRYFVEADLAAGTLLAVRPDLPLQTDAFRLVWRRGHPLADELRSLAAALRARPLA